MVDPYCGLCDTRYNYTLGIFTHSVHDEADVGMRDMHMNHHGRFDQSYLMLYDEHDEFRPGHFE
jgi:hypothetical protein